MADLNALIAQGAQFQAMPDPFVQYGRMQQLEQGQQANQLNRMKMEEAQAAAVERNALRGLNPTSRDYESQLFKVNPQLGIAYRKERTAAEAQQATQERQNVDAAAARQGMLGQAYRDISSRPSDANITAHMEDVDASTLFNTEEKNAVKKLSQTLLSMPIEQRGAFLASQGAKSSDLIVKPTPTNLARLQAEKAALPVGDLRIPQYDAAIAKESQAAMSPLAKLQAEMKALPPGDPRIPQYAAAINKETTRAPAPVVNISNITEKAEAADFGKLLVKDYDAIKASSDLARKSLPALESNLAILNNGFSTGFGTETVAAGAKVLGALGVKDAEKFATNAQVFLANANNAVLQKQLEQKGVQTAADADRITSTGAQLGNTKDANEFIIKVAKEQLQRDIEQRDFYAAWRDKNQTFNGAENAWSTGPGSKSLFDRPALKAYAAGPNVKEVAPDRTKGLDKIFGKPR
jgi:hypothetical protein